MGPRALLIALLTIVPACVAVPADPSGSGDPFANSAAETQDGLVEIAGRSSYAIHAHRGEPSAALLDAARFRLRNRRAHRVRVTVDAVELLVGARRDVVEVRELPFLGFSRRAGPEPAAQLQPGVSDLVVRFEPVEAAVAWDEPFAFRVRFSVEGEPLVATAETVVEREEERIDGEASD